MNTLKLFQVFFTLILLGLGLTSGKSIGILEGEKVHENCLKAPETVLIECKIHSENNASGWKCIEPNVISVPVIYGNSSDNRVLVNCTAPYPIDVEITGFQLQDIYKTLFIRNAENVFNEATFVYSIGIIADNFTSPRRITITKYNDPSSQMSFFMFRPGAKESTAKFVPSNPIALEATTTTGKTTIPCVSDDPYHIPELKARESNQLIAVNQSGVRYDKTQGFIFDANPLTKPKGFYECFDETLLNSSSDGEQKPVVFEIFPRQELLVEPNLKNIILFKNHELNLKCRYKGKIQFVGNFRGETIRSQTTVDGDEFTSIFTQRKVKVGDKGQINCTDEENAKVLHTWNIDTLDIYDNSALQLTKLNNNQVACLSPYDDVKIETVFCQGVSNCDSNQGCFQQGSKCPNFREGFRCKNATGSCLNFTTDGYYFTQGMIRCKAQNVTYTTKYFRGYDDILYLDWESAPLNALIEVRVPTNITMYPHNSYPFGCRASKFISDGKIQWVIRGKDGSEILLHKKRVQDISPTYDNLNYDLYTVRESNIRLIYPNDYDILCMVPMWNSTASLRYHKRINVAAKTAPVKEIVIAACSVIILLIIPLVYVIWRLKKAKEAIRNLTDQEVEEFIKGNPAALQQAGNKDKDAHEVVDSIPYNKDLEIPRNKLLIDNENILGEGAFGTVLKGKVEGISEVVAVKTVKPRCEVLQFKGFLSELKIMMHIGKHPFVVGLIGAYTDKIKEKVIYIVVEYCVHGSLESFLRNQKGFFIDQIQNNTINAKITASNVYSNLADANSNKHGNQIVLKTVDLIRWSYEIASGMAHLESKKVVHADLASRNVLIHGNGTAKITDFGLSRQLFDYTQYVKKQQEPLPWRWMAIESLRNLTFSTHSDVWAFGVTLWELFSLGDVPYPGLAWTISFVEQLQGGLRMVKPPHSTSAIYNIMLDCWKEKPNVRPSFSLLSEYFYDMLTSLDVNLKVNQFPDCTVRNSVAVQNQRNDGSNWNAGNIYQN